MQGVAPDETGRLELLGIALARHLSTLADEGRLPPLSRCGAVLAGDLFSTADATRRGGFGDVSDVWRAFTTSFAWTIGGAGNHDDVSRVEGPSLLDGDVAERGGLRIGGVGLIAGSPHKPGRRDAQTQQAALELVLEAIPNLVVLHEGPRGDADQPGSDDVTRLLCAAVSLTVFGHCHWKRPLYRTPSGTWLNVDGRVVVLWKE